MSETEKTLAPPGTLVAPRRNLKTAERGGSLMAGSLMGVLAARRGGVPGVLFGVLGSLLIARGVTGMSPAKRVLGQKPEEVEIARKAGWSNAAVLSSAVTLNAARDKVYARFRDLVRWPEWATHIETVEIASDGVLHLTTSDHEERTVWKGKITEETEGALLAFAALEGAEVPVTLRFEFRDAPGGRGTEIHGVIAYEPPAGTLGLVVAKLARRAPDIDLRRDLKRFKSLIETGEIAVNAPQSTDPEA